MNDTGLHLIYFADPMCSWCWGFAPAIAQIQRRYEAVLPLRLVMGGLRPGTDKPMTDDAKREIMGHWTHVAEASGQPFEYALLEREGFVYDTDPAARAVVLARRADPDRAMALLERLQRAFYAEGRDVTKAAVLAELAAELGFDRELFEAGLGDAALKAETWRDYAVSQRAGVRGFPTLVVGPNGDGVFNLATSGFNAADAVIAGIDGWLAQVQAA